MRSPATELIVWTSEAAVQTFLPLRYAPFDSVEKRTCLGVGERSQIALQIEGWENFEAKRTQEGK